MFPGCVRSGISPEGFNGGLLLPSRGLSYFLAANLFARMANETDN
jgi:hypothetical protein